MVLPSENRMLMPLKIGIDQTFYASLWNSLYFAARRPPQGQIARVDRDRRQVQVLAAAQGARARARSTPRAICRVPRARNRAPRLRSRACGPSSSAPRTNALYLLLSTFGTTLLFTPRSLRRLGPGRAANTTFPTRHPSSPQRAPPEGRRVRTRSARVRNGPFARGRVSPLWCLRAEGRHAIPHSNARRRVGSSRTLAVRASIVAAITYGRDRPVRARTAAACCGSIASTSRAWSRAILARGRQRRRRRRWTAPSQPGEVAGAALRSRRAR